MDLISTSKALSWWGPPEDNPCSADMINRDITFYEMPVMVEGGGTEGDIVSGETEGWCRVCLPCSISLSVFSLRSLSFIPFKSSPLPMLVCICGHAGLMDIRGCHFHQDVESLS